MSYAIWWYGNETDETNFFFFFFRKVLSDHIAVFLNIALYLRIFILLVYIWYVFIISCYLITVIICWVNPTEYEKYMFIHLNKLLEILKTNKQT